MWKENVLYIQINYSMLYQFFIFYSLRDGKVVCKKVLDIRLHVQFLLKNFQL